jgi:hypothetical protein
LHSYTITNSSCNILICSVESANIINLIRVTGAEKDDTRLKCTIERSWNEILPDFITGTSKSFKTGQVPVKFGTKHTVISTEFFNVTQELYADELYGCNELYE